MTEAIDETTKGGKPMLLYHTGFDVIQTPDLTVGRKNADFGQGFYLSADADFSRRWATERKGRQTVINRYALSLEGLAVTRFEKSEDWFRCILNNRAGLPDAFAAQDVVIGPIANDTLFQTWGILTSGVLTDAQALRLLQIEPSYTQVVIKTEKAAAQLQWLGAEILTHDDLSANAELLEKEQDAFQRTFAALFEELVDAEENSDD